MCCFLLSPPPSLSFFISSLRRATMTRGKCFSGNIHQKHSLPELEESRNPPVRPAPPPLFKDPGSTTWHHPSVTEFRVSEPCECSLYSELNCARLFLCTVRCLCSNSLAKDVDSSNSPQGTIHRAHLKRFVLLVLILLFLNKFPALNVTGTREGSRHHTLYSDQRKVTKRIPRVKKKCTGRCL